MQQNNALSISQSPHYQQLVKTRTRFGIILTFITVLIYFGFIYTVAFHKDWLATTIGSGVTTYSIPVGMGVILFTVLLTGVYVRRANAEFDALTEKIKKEFS